MINILEPECQGVTVFHHKMDVEPKYKQQKCGPSELMIITPLHSSVVHDIS